MIAARPSLDPGRQDVSATALLRGQIAQQPRDWRN
jgi:hypothetical protein